MIVRDSDDLFLIAGCDMDVKLKSRMLKILALAKQGVGGEQENAERMLEVLCKKHGVSLDELEGAHIERRRFYVNSKFEESLLCQVVDLFVDDEVRRNRMWLNKARSRAREFDLTDGEFAQVKVGLETYKAAWLDQVDLFFSAFVHKNRIYGNREREQKELTDEQILRAKKVSRMMGAASKVDVLPRVEDKAK